MDNLYESIFFISAFLYLLFALFLFTNKKGDRLSNRIFAVFCLFEAFIIMSDLGNMFRQTVFRSIPPYIAVILESVFFLMGPLLYFYTLSLTRKESNFKKIHFLHLIPFLLDLTFQNFRFFTQTNVRELLIDHGYFISLQELRARYMLADIHVIIYLAASLFLLHKYRGHLKAFFSSLEKMKLSWLSMVLLGFSTVRLLHLSKLTLGWRSETLKDILGLASHIGALLLATVVVYRALSRPEIFSYIKVQTKSGQPKYAKTALSHSKMEEYLQMMIQCMEVDRPYLNPELNINDLSERLSIPSHHISQTLSRHLKQNFYHFINRYRIEECKRIFSDLDEQNKTILEILYETGFNSKSTFNSIFKQYTGMTPTQFIISQRRNKDH